jgi:hypothetical protein
MNNYPGVCIYQTASQTSETNRNSYDISSVVYAAQAVVGKKKIWGSVTGSAWFESLFEVMPDKKR